MTRKTQQIIIVIAILMTVALLMVVVGGMGVGDSESDSVGIYLNEIDTLVTDNPDGEDTSSRLDTIAERAQDLEETRAQEGPRTAAAPAPREERKETPKTEPAEKPKSTVVAEATEAQKEATRRAEAKVEEEKTEAVAAVEQEVIDDTDEEVASEESEPEKKKKVKREGKPSKMKEIVKSYAKRVKPILEARGMDLSELEGRSAGDQIRMVGKKLIEALRANGGSLFEG